MQKQLLIGCNGRRALHTTEPPVEEQFRLVRESGAFDYFDRGEAVITKEGNTL